VSSSFTAWKRQDVDEFVEVQLQEVSLAVQSLMQDNLHSLVLSGGFGRGEGSVRIHPDGQMRVVNDYDIEVVYREPYGVELSKLFNHLLYSKRLEAVAMSLADSLNVKQIDLSLRGLSTFSGSASTRLCDYDMLHGHRLIYGEDDPTNHMPPVAATDISPFEGTWLFRNRGLGLLLASFYIDDNKIVPGKAEYFDIEINKALLAIGDALFILEGRYQCSYSERLKSIQEALSTEVPARNEIVQRYTEACSTKLKPRPQVDITSDPEQRLQEVLRLYLDVFLYHESRRLGTGFKDLRDYFEHQTPLPPLTAKLRAKLLYQRLTDSLGNGNSALNRLKVSPMGSVLMTMLLLEARCSSDLAESYRQMACVLSGDRASNNDSFSWDALCREFLLLIHPKGELGRTLNRNGRAS
jgi:hypothetical protein